jgi:hypothetical protein
MLKLTIAIIDECSTLHGCVDGIMPKSIGDCARQHETMNVIVSHETFTRRAYRPRRSRFETANSETKPCSRCGNEHSSRNYYCNPCRANYMRGWRARAKTEGQHGQAQSPQE